MNYSIQEASNRLVDAIKETEEYKEYKRLKDIVYQDATNKSLLDEYKRLQYRMQASMATGQQLDTSSDDFQRMQKILQVLQFNSDCSNFLLAEIRYQQLISEVYKNLTEISGFDLDLFMRG